MPWKNYLLNGMLQITIWQYPDGAIISIPGRRDWKHPTTEAAETALLTWVDANGYGLQVCDEEEEVSP